MTYLALLAAAVVLVVAAPALVFGRLIELIVQRSRR